MLRRFATFGLQQAKYLCPYKSRKVLSQALQFQTLTAQSPVGYVKHRLAASTGHFFPGSITPYRGTYLSRFLSGSRSWHRCSGPMCLMGRDQPGRDQLQERG